VIDDATRRRWDAEAEEDARGLIRIRDTLALVRAEDFPKSRKARQAARQAEDVATAIDLELERQLNYCPKCDEGDLDVRLSDRWSIRCKSCGWTVPALTWTEAVDAWNGEGSE
jgi:ssDNA-binding Zn-finger/Zn-ribbon topoisomerase 1